MFSLRNKKIIFELSSVSLKNHRIINKYRIHLVIGQKFMLPKLSEIQSTLDISKSKGPAETLRDIRTSTYQMCRIEENTKRPAKFHK